MYDARGGGNANNGTMFAVALGGVVAAAFAAVVFWPTGSGSSDTPVAVAERSLNINAVFPGNEERKFAQILKDVDVGAYQTLESRFSRGNLSATERHEIMMETAQEVAFDHIDTLAKSDVKHMDALMDDIIGGLQSASRSRAKLCKGSTYTSLEGMSPRQMEKFLEREIISNPDVQAFAVKLNRRILEAIVDGRKNPKRYGKLDATDKRAMDGIGRKLMSDPKILRILMSAGASSNPEDVLATLDVCDLSVTVLRVVDRLPPKTKGRIWAQSFAEVRKQGTFGFDPNSLSQFGGF